MQAFTSPPTLTSRFSISPKTIDRYKIALGLGVILSLAAIASIPELRSGLLEMKLFNIEHWRSLIEASGAWGPLLYIALLAVSVIISQIPGAPLALFAGSIWHPQLAGFYTVVGGFLGAAIAYELGKRYGRGMIQRLIGKDIAISFAHSENYLGSIIFLTRLFPVISFDLISYGAGISGLSWPKYATATLFGMIPSTYLLVYCGDSLSFSWESGLLMICIAATGFILMPWLLVKMNGVDIESLNPVKS